MQILLGFFQVFKYPIYFLFGLILVWFVSFAYFFIKEYAQGRRLKRGDRKSTRLNSSHTDSSRMPSSA